MPAHGFEGAGALQPHAHLLIDLAIDPDPAQDITARVLRQLPILGWSEFDLERAEEGALKKAVSAEDGVARSGGGGGSDRVLTLAGRGAQQYEDDEDGQQSF